MFKNLFKKKEKEMNKAVYSPTFKKPIEIAKEVAMTFPEAIKKVIEGNKITRIYWKNAKIYGILEDNILKIKLENGKLDGWLLSDGDLKAEDWLII